MKKFRQILHLIWDWLWFLFWITIILILSFVNNTAPMDGSGNKTKWIKWLPWGGYKKAKK